MAEFEFAIAEYLSLNEYFTRFPKQLMFLVDQGEIAKFSPRGILINYDKLSHYLKSPESIFETRSVQDFLETLTILGFSRGLVPEKNEEDGGVVFRFANPNFIKGEEAPDFLYKLPIDSSHLDLKKTKRMINIHCIDFLQRILKMKTRQEFKISNMEFAHLRLKFALQNQLDTIRNQQSVVDFDIEYPEYVKNKEIHGYYGSVSIQSLKTAFGESFPVYQEPVVVQVPEMDKDEAMVVVDDLPAKEQPPKKKRRYNKKARDVILETNQAVHYMQQESMDVKPDEE